MAASAFLASLYYGRKARMASDSEEARKALTLSLPLSVVGFVLLFLGWRGLAQ